MLANIARGVWALQIIFGVVVLAISVVLIKQQVFGGAPATLGFGSFAGAFACVAGLVGMAGTFLEIIPDIVILGIDGLSGLFALAGGIAFAIQMKGINCNVDIQKDADNFNKAMNNALLNEGTVNSNKEDFANGISQRICGPKDSDSDFIKCVTAKIEGALEDRCNKVVADQALLFVTFGFAVATAALAFYMWKKGKRGGSRAYV